MAQMIQHRTAYRRTKAVEFRVSREFWVTIAAVLGAYAVITFVALSGIAGTQAQAAQPFTSDEGALLSTSGENARPATTQPIELAATQRPGDH